jgi:hypothetical protein
VSLDIYFRCPTCKASHRSFNITHNVIPMWVEGGCYEALYESDGKSVKSILPAIDKAIRDMEARPKTYEALNPKNGWGNAGRALEFLREVFAAAKDSPDSYVIGVSR